MTINEACISLAKELLETYKPATFTVGHDEQSQIFVYEHTDTKLPNKYLKYENFDVVRQYMGPITLE